MYIEDIQLPESPFAFLRSAELEAICSSSGFQILREYLANALPVEYDLNLSNKVISSSVY
jgi:hypothetical protein